MGITVYIAAAQSTINDDPTIYLITDGDTIFFKVVSYDEAICLSDSIVS